ncbi:unnamed protein product [Malus baccata var. baccata]
MAEEGKPDAQLFQLLFEEVELRPKIEALGLELEIANELDKLSTQLDDVDEMISSAMAADPQVKSLLSGTADVCMPVITSTVDERHNFTTLAVDDSPKAKKRSSS